MGGGHLARLQAGGTLAPERQSEEEVVAEDEAAMDDPSVTTMQVPHDLVPVVRELIAK
ncbi:MAG TPA: hypothetical protein PLQ89_05995 [Phycisphaerae bacterium]|nr:hypothetical protein [Phycisphaerae bacterium]HOJ73571.1 hypothetical protein [Phycisphaerae bacterium]HOM51620.1 hypothetical protein [Phycisphaerae bacterium]HON65386.1 hypothetical protein [Phycisphaerae bacterium]HOQ85253.1 hypothetical protein [Phycisphaerae bacterium]